MVQKKRIIIIDDHPLFREGIKTILNRKPKYEVVGETGTGREGLQMVKDLKPDLVLLDLSLPDIGGLNLIGDILQSSVKTGILIVSMHSKIDYIVKSFQYGAMGYIVKESAADTLLNAIAHILNGDYYMDTSVSQKMVKKLATLPAKKSISAKPGYEALTPREQEVMAMVAEGMNAVQVADKLFISPKTAENHRSNIMRKLGLQNTIELVRYAAKIGLIDIDLWKE
ncbi:MAG: response regulator transcription factor [Desulfosarcina sp.]|nr:response regulator transcription factor [Desulfosarcina sp.]